MSLRGRVVEGLHSAYGVANRLGLLRNRVLSDLFVRTYFAYKRRGDPFEPLTRRRPDLFRGGHVLDVGANIGYTAAVFARALDPGFRVFAFEPDRENFQRLEREMRRRGLSDRVEAVHTAVGASEGTVGLWRDYRHHAGHRIATNAFRVARTLTPADTVPLVSLDHFIQSRGIDGPICFVKIDVEGYEPPVCEGMATTVAVNPRLVVAIEYSPSSMSQLGFRPESVIDFFRSKGFEIRRLSENGSLLAFDEYRPDEPFGGRAHVDLLCSRQSLGG